MLKEEKSIYSDNTTDVASKGSVNQALKPCERKSEKKQGTESFDQQYNTVYAYYGQYAAPRETYYDYAAEQEYLLARRNRFVLIVFSIVFVLLSITVIFNIIVHLSPPLNDFFKSMNGAYLAYGCLGGWLVISVCVLSCQSTYYPPLNYFVLLVALVCQSGLTAFLTANTDTNLVIYAIGATAVVVLIIMFLACTKWDFTVYWNYVMVGAIAVGVVTLMIYVGMAVTKTRLSNLVIVMTIIGTFMQSVVLLLVLQSIIGGKAVEMNENLYIIAAYDVYMSIIMIFIKLLQLFRELK